MNNFNQKNIREAIAIIKEEGKISVPLLRRRLMIGYFKAESIIEQLEENGWIGKANGSKPREILIK